MFLSTRNDSVEFRARHGFDVYAHCPAASPVVTLSFWDAEAEVVLVSAVGRYANLENAEAFGNRIRDFKIIVSVLDTFEALFLVKDEFLSNRTVKRDRQGVLEAELELVVCLDDGRLGRLDQVALLRNVLISDIVTACLADSADFAHVRVRDKVDIAANWRKVGRNFEFFAVLGRGTCATNQE